MGFLKNLLGKRPKVDADTTEVKEDANNTLKSRRAIYATSGGVKGEEVLEVNQKKRGSLFGNVG